MNHAQSMSQSIVVSTRVCEVTDSKLMNSSEPLNFRRVEQLKQPTVNSTIDTDVVVQRVAKDFGRHLSSDL